MEVLFTYHSKDLLSDITLRMPTEDIFGKAEMRQGEYVKIYSKDKISTMFKISKIFYEIEIETVNNEVIDMKKIVILEE